MTTLDLDAIEARANAAPEGPWDSGPIYQSNESWLWVKCGIAGDPDAPDTRFGTVATEYAAFIAAARTDVPALLTHCRALTAELAEAKRAEDPQSRFGSATELWAKFAEEKDAETRALTARAEKAESERDGYAKFAAQYKDAADHLTWGAEGMQLHAATAIRERDAALARATSAEALLDKSTSLIDDAWSSGLWQEDDGEYPRVATWMAEAESLLDTTQRAYPKMFDAALALDSAQGAKKETGR